MRTTAPRSLPLNGFDRIISQKQGTMSNRYVSRLSSTKHSPFSHRAHPLKPQTNIPRFGRDTSRTSNSLFNSSPYNRSPSPSKTKSKKPLSPAYSSYAFPPSSAAPSTDNLFPSQPGVGPAFGAYPGANGGVAGANAGYRTATPNSRGQYSDAVLSELESQNDDEIGVLTGKVRMLKDVCLQFLSSSTVLLLSSHKLLALPVYCY